MYNFAVKENPYSLPRDEVADEMISTAWKKLAASKNIRKVELVSFLEIVLESERIRFRKNLPKDNPYINLLVASQELRDKTDKDNASELFRFLIQVLDKGIILWLDNPEKATEMGLPSLGEHYIRLDLCKNIVIY